MGCKLLVNGMAYHEWERLAEFLGEPVEFVFRLTHQELVRRTRLKIAERARPGGRLSSSQPVNRHIVGELDT